MYVCDLCGNRFNRVQLDDHFTKTAIEAVEILSKSGDPSYIWTGNVVTFNDEGKAWCPYCFKNAKKMRSGGRTVHAGERRPYLRLPNITVTYRCKCGKLLSFNCQSVNIFTGLEVICVDCRAVMFVPPTIFDQSKPTEFQEASLCLNYYDQMKFIASKNRNQANRSNQ